MAIVFEKQLTLTDLLFSYNNNTVTFKSNSSLTVRKATLAFNGLVFTLFPDPANKFYFNFKYSISTLLNGTNNFSDQTNLDIVTPIANAFKTRVLADGGTFEAYDCLIAQITELGVDPIIDYTDYIFNDFAVTYKIFFTNDTSETQTITYNFLSAYVNTQDYKKLYPGFPYNADTTQMMLKPIPYLKYWNGYPFDFTWYNGLMNDIVIGNVLYENSNFLKSFEYTLTTTPTANEFYTPVITWSRTVGQSVTFKFNNTGAENIFAAISVNDIIKITDGVLAGYKFKVTSIAVAGTVYTFGFEILSLSLGFFPEEGAVIPFTFEIANDVIDSETYTNDKRINRIIFSNGTELIELESAYNRLLVNGTELQIEKITDICEGHYIKWLNSFGGWNYWLFYKGNDTLTTKDLGTIFNDYEDVVDTISPYVSIGKTSENNIAVVQDNITQNEMLILNDLLDTPKVYLFTGTPNQNVQCKEWLEVNIKSGAFRVSNSREKMNSLSLTIEIPTNTTKIL
jgi:hypothetical protein